MLSAPSKTFAVQIGNFRMETISSKIVLMHIVPVVVLFVAVYIVVQVLSGGMQRFRIHEKKMIIRKKPFQTRLMFIIGASLAGSLLAAAIPAVAGVNVLGAIAISVITVLLLVYLLLRWFFGINSRMTIDLASRSFIRGRRSASLDSWNGVAVELHRSESARKTEVPLHLVYLIPADATGNPLVGLGRMGMLASFKNEKQAREMAAEVARFCGFSMAA